MKIVIFICGLFLLSACGVKTASDVRLPAFYNCKIAIVEGVNKWKDAELRQGLDITDLKLAKGYERPQVGFNSVRYEDKTGDIAFTLTLSSATLLMGGESLSCTPIK